MSTRSSLEPQKSGVAFLLAQVGAHAAERFAGRLGPLKLTPAHAGILRAIHHAEGISQQALAQHLGMFPSRMVLVLDEMGRLGLVERRPSAKDRRTYALHLTAGGQDKLEAIGRIAREHQEALCAALNPGERETLASLLSRIAEQQHLTAGVHPGYRKLGRGNEGSC
jgi:DNA-binding MarR family transcriptional regulator